MGGWEGGLAMDRRRTGCTCTLLCITVDYLTTRSPVPLGRRLINRRLHPAHPAHPVHRTLRTVSCDRRRYWGSTRGVLGWS